jgi:hypothetical protein
MRTTSNITQPNSYTLPDSGYVLIGELVNNSKKGTLGILRVGRTTFLNNVKIGAYPAPVKLSQRTNGWRVEDIAELLEQLDNGLDFKALQEKNKALLEKRGGAV